MLTYFLTFFKYPQTHYRKELFYGIFDGKHEQNPIVGHHTH